MKNNNDDNDSNDGDDNIYSTLVCIHLWLQGDPKKWKHLVAYYATRCSHFLGLPVYAACL